MNPLRRRHGPGGGHDVISLGPILEITYQVERQEDIADLRSLRQVSTSASTCGPGRSGRGRRRGVLPQADASVGTVLALETFEHVRRFWKGFDEVRRVLRPDGALLAAVPFHFHVHAYPHDYWRFTPDAFKVLFEDYPSKIVGAGAARPGWPTSGASSSASAATAITPDEFARYQELLPPRPCRCQRAAPAALRRQPAAVRPRPRPVAGSREMPERMSEFGGCDVLGASHAFAAVGVVGYARRPASAAPAPSGCRPVVSVCIANWNCRRLLHASLRSLTSKLS